MKISEFKNHLKGLTAVQFVKPDGSAVPAHFHITEIGQIDKKYIDCGGTVRLESYITMQLWESEDHWHRLVPSKLASIIALAEKTLNIGDYTIEVEYQAETIAKFGLRFANGIFILQTTQTTCLASDQCGIPFLETIGEKTIASCAPGGGCC
jgi:hypothetical protein